MFEPRHDHVDRLSDLLAPFERATVRDKPVTGYGPADLVVVSSWEFAFDYKLWLQTAAEGSYLVAHGPRGNDRDVNAPMFADWLELPVPGGLVVLKK